MNVEKHLTQQRIRFQAQQHSWQPQNLDYLIVSMLGSTEGTYYIDGPPISPPISSPNKLGNQLRRVWWRV